MKKRRKFLPTAVLFFCFLILFLLVLIGARVSTKNSRQANAAAGPVVSIASSSAKEIESGIVPVNLLFPKNYKYSEINFYVDGKIYSKISVPGGRDDHPYQVAFSLDTTTMSHGDHLISFEVFNIDGTVSRPALMLGVPVNK